jgi:hypothetical protein
VSDTLLSPPSPPSDLNSLPTVKNKRWPWAIGVVSTLAIGVGVAVSISGGHSTALPAAEAQTTAEVGTSCDRAVGDADGLRCIKGKWNPVSLLPAAAKSYTKGSNSGYKLADDDYTLIVDGEGLDYGNGDADFDDAKKVLKNLGASEALLARMGNTRALDGTQDASWSDDDGVCPGGSGQHRVAFTVSWSYHPDNGLDLVITQEIE